MRVLILSQYYFPEAVPKPHELAEELSARGHEVFVITGFPHYPGGVLSEGYKLRPWLRETINGIDVTRTFELPYHSTNPLLRVANYLSFMISAPFAAFFTPKCDVIYVWHPPQTIGIAAWIISKLKRAPFVYDVQDIWGHFTVVSGMVREGSFAVKLIRAMENFVSKRADSLIVQTPAGKQYFAARNVAPEKIAILPHWIDESAFTETADSNIREEFGFGSKFVVLFAGNIGIVQGLDSVIDAAAKLSNDFLLVFLGDGTDRPRLRSLAEKADLMDRVMFIDRQPPERMPEFFAAADALLVSLRKSEVGKFVIPSKTVAYLASGKPIIMATGGASEDLINDAKAGICVEPENGEALAEAIIKLKEMSWEERSELGKTGRKYLLANFAKQNVISDYEELLVSNVR